MSFLQCLDLIKVYQSAEEDHLQVAALRGVELEINEGQLVSVIGPSGAGKTTLLNILGGIDTPTSGSVRVGDIFVHSLKRSALNSYRRKMVGILWQIPSRNLLWNISVLQNVLLPMKIGGIKTIPRETRLNRALDLLRYVGLHGKVHRKPSQLSGGEAQRAGLAVALANDPALLLADEPTGELDHHTTLVIIDFLKELNQDLEKTMIIATHDLRFARRSHVIYRIQDGRIGEMRLPGYEKIKSAEDHDFVALVDKDRHIRLPEDMCRRLGIRKHVRIRERKTHLEVIPYDT